MLSKKTLKSEVGREIIAEISVEYDVSITRACRIICFHKSLYYYCSRRDDSEVEASIRSATESNKGIGEDYMDKRQAQEDQDG